MLGRLRRGLGRVTGGAEETRLPRGPWSEAMLATRAGVDPDGVEIADQMLALAATATAARPSKAFKTERDRLVETYGRERTAAVAALLLEAAVAVRGSERIGIPSPELGDVLRGLAFVATAAGGDDATRALAALAIAGWRKVPGCGAADVEGGQRGDQRPRRAARGCRAARARPGPAQARDRGGLRRQGDRRRRRAARHPARRVRGAGGARLRARRRRQPRHAARRAHRRAHPRRRPQFPHARRQGAQVRSRRRQAGPSRGARRAQAHRQGDQGDGDRPAAAARAAADRGPQLDGRRVPRALPRARARRAARAAPDLERRRRPAHVRRRAAGRRRRPSGCGTPSTPRPTRCSAGGAARGGRASPSRSSRPTARSTCSPTPSGRPSTYSNRFAAHVLRQHQFAALCRDARLGATALRAASTAATTRPDARRCRSTGSRPSSGSTAGATTATVERDRHLPAPPTDQVRFTGGGERAAAARARSRRSCSARSCATSTCSSASPASATTRRGSDGGPEAATATTGSATLRRAHRHRPDPPRGARAAPAPAHDRRPSRRSTTASSSSAATCARTRSTSAVGEHPDGAQRPVPLHRRPTATQRRARGRRLPAVRGRRDAVGHPQQGVPAGRRRQDHGPTITRQIRAAR